MKLGEWNVFIITMIIFLELVGVPTGLGILSDFGISVTNGTFSGGDLEGAYFWALLLGILSTVGIGSAVIIGFFTKSYDTSIVIAPMIVAVVGLFGSTFFAIMTMDAIVDVSWIKNIVSLLFTGMGVAFIWSAIDYFAGR